jgi:pimeloyl-ACP methyl ester carboxylesterase
MEYVTSRDGTRIAYDKSGEGPPVVLVDGALCSRSFGPMPPLAALLSERFSVVAYDRRGRGDSGDTPPYAVDREIDDIEALIDEVGGAAFLYGASSGAALGLETALKLPGKVAGLAMYEAPYAVDAGVAAQRREYTRQLEELLAADRRGDAVALFMTLVGVPAEQIDAMRGSPTAQVMKAIAPTLAYDNRVVGEDRLTPTARAAAVAVPTLVMNGGAAQAPMRNVALALAQAIPGARYRELEGQTHSVSPQIIAPVLVEFFEELERKRAGRVSDSTRVA